MNKEKTALLRIRYYVAERIFNNYIEIRMKSQNIADKKLKKESCQVLARRFFIMDTG